MRWFKAAALTVALASSTSSWALDVSSFDGIRAEAFRLYDHTVSEVVVVAAYEGLPKDKEQLYQVALSDWVQQALKDNGIKINPTSLGAPRLRVGGFCGSSVKGCDLTLAINRDVYFDFPDGRRFTLDRFDLASIKLHEDTAVYSPDGLFPLIRQAIGGFVRGVKAFNIDPPMQINKPVPNWPVDESGNRSLETWPSSRPAAGSGKSKASLGLAEGEELVN